MRKRRCLLERRASRLQRERGLRSTHIFRTRTEATVAHAREVAEHSIARPPASHVEVCRAPRARAANRRGRCASWASAHEVSVERSKAYHASENLATAYGYYIDEFAWDDTADIFSRDGWKELAFVGTYVGRERIRQSLKLRYPGPKSPAGGEGSWISGIYENTSVNENGTWKLSGMDLDYVWNAPSRGGWVRIKRPPTAPDVAMAKTFPPDRPLRGSIAAPFPKVYTVPLQEPGVWPRPACAAAVERGHKPARNLGRTRASKVKNFHSVSVRDGSLISTARRQACAFRGWQE